MSKKGTAVNNLAYELGQIFHVEVKVDWRREAGLKIMLPPEISEDEFSGVASRTRSLIVVRDDFREEFKGVNFRPDRDGGYPIFVVTG